jgi:hypothetical protein
LHLLKLGSNVSIVSCSNYMIPKVLLYWRCAMTFAFVMYTVFLAGYVEICKLVAVRAYVCSEHARRG